MSIIQAVLSKLITDLKNWRTLDQHSQIEIFKQAHFLFGRPFLQALTEIEVSPKLISFWEDDHLISIDIKNKKQIIFPNSKKIVPIQCSCQATWKRKLGENKVLLCKHEILFLLWKYCFLLPLSAQSEELKSAVSLMELLSVVK